MGPLTDNQVLLLEFADWLADIDSEPFAHEHTWTKFVGDIREESAR